MKLLSLRALAGVAALTAIGFAMAQSPTTQPSTSSTQQNFAQAIAKADLSKQGITNPTPTQLGTATSQVEGMRASGMGWGAIANSLGLNLGSIVSAQNQNINATDKSPGAPLGKDNANERSSGANAGQGNAGGKGKGGGQGGGGGGSGGRGGGKG